MHGAFRAAIHRAGAGIGIKKRPDYYFLQDFAATGPHYRLSRLEREDRAAAASRLDGSGYGHEGPGVVRGFAGGATVRRDWRYDSRFAHAASRRRPARRSLRSLRTVAIAGVAFVFSKRYGVPGMRADHQHYVPGIGGKRSRLHSEHDTHLEDAVRRRGRIDAGGDGLHRKRAR